jgi:hypothetical protein
MEFLCCNIPFAVSRPPETEGRNIHCLTLEVILVQTGIEFEDECKFFLYYTFRTCDNKVGYLDGKHKVSVNRIA